MLIKRYSCYCFNLHKSITFNKTKYYTSNSSIPELKQFGGLLVLLTCYGPCNLLWSMRKMTAEMIAHFVCIKEHLSTESTPEVLVIVIVVCKMPLKVLCITKLFRTLCALVWPT